MFIVIAADAVVVVAVIISAIIITTANIIQSVCVCVCIAIEHIHLMMNSIRFTMFVCMIVCNVMYELRMNTMW